jgi:flagellar biosynthesis GTPase FlhF
MHIKRFVARDMKHAIRLVRDEQGPDAVILSNQRVPGGIEIIAAVDYDPRLINDALIANVATTAPAGSRQRGATNGPRRRGERSPEPESFGPTPAVAERTPAQDDDEASELIAALRARAARPRATEASDESGRTAQRSSDAPSARRATEHAPPAQSTAAARRTAERSPAAPAPTEASPDDAPAGRNAAATTPTRRRISLADMPADGIVVRHETTPPADGEREDRQHATRPRNAAATSAATTAEKERRTGPQNAGRTSPPASLDECDDPWDDHDDALTEREVIRRANQNPWPLEDAHEELPEDDEQVLFEAFVAAERDDAVWTGIVPGDETSSASHRDDAPRDGLNGPPTPAADGRQAAPKRTEAERELRYSDILDDDELPDGETTSQPGADAADGVAPWQDEVVRLSDEAQTEAGADPRGNGGFLSVLADVTGLGKRTGRRKGPARVSAPIATDGADLPSPNEGSAPGRESRLIIRSLTRVGVGEGLARQLTDTVSRGGRTGLSWPDVLAQASARLNTLGEEIIDTGGIVALVGPTGVGKTTTIAKLAARFALKYGRDRLALLTTDTFRVGAHEQLNTFAGILGVPLHSVDDATDLTARLKQLSKNRLVLIDTAGMSQRDMRLGEELALLSRSRANIRVLLTLSANAERRTMLDAIERFSSARPIGCVLTKLDETLAPGTALSALIETGLPLAYTCDGQNVPEDLYWATSKRKGLVQQVFRQADTEGRHADDADTDEVRESA